MPATANKDFFTVHEHRLRIAAALRRRLHPQTNLHPKQLAAAIGVTAMTISNWRRGLVDPGSYELTKLFHFFFATEGSPGFWIDIFGEPGGEQPRSIPNR